MAKKFNITGTCVPEKHYMVDISNKLEKIAEMIDDGDYFTINRARQFGKTTTLSAIRRHLSGKYLVIQTSFEGYGDEAFVSAKSFAGAFLRGLSQILRFGKEIKLAEFCMLHSQQTEAFDELSSVITDLCAAADKPIVLLIDEVDKSSDNQTFLNFIGMLRNKYLDRNVLGINSTFHSVILAGVHDVKNLKLKIRPEAEHKYNSPWNIAAEFEVDMSFKPLEISTMLIDYENDHKTGMDIMSISNEIYKYTSGYPFLVSKICKVIDEKLDKNWTVQGVQDAVKIMTAQPNTLFESLTKNLENNKEFKSFIYAISVLDAKIQFNIYENNVKLGSLYSIIKPNANGKVVIHNLIFEKVIYDYFITQDTIKRANNHEATTDESGLQYIVNGKLDFSCIVKKFQLFMYAEHRQKDQKFIEQNGRLLFLSFLKLLLNGRGFYYVEPETRNSSRMDLIVTYGGEEFIVELKIWRGQKYETEGKKQLAEYLKTRGLDAGYLVTFDFSKNKKQTEPAWVECEGKKIYEAII